jgi:hypothetical protein
MDIEQVKCCNDTISHRKKIRDEVLNNILLNTEQLFFTQLHLFTVLASLSIAISGLQYVIKGETGHLALLSIFFSVITLLFSVSFTRESIDMRDKTNNETTKYVREESRMTIEAAEQAMNNNDFSVLSQRFKDEWRKDKDKTSLNYSGEIITFCFYLSLGFLLASFVPNSDRFAVDQYTLIIVIFIAYLLSFKSWASDLTILLSREYIIKKKGSKQGSL